MGISLKKKKERKPVISGDRNLSNGYLRVGLCTETDREKIGRNFLEMPVLWQKCECHGCTNS
jgi:hypothetical protein